MSKHIIKFLIFSCILYFFAVQSVSATENESLAVVPTVGR